MFLKGVAPAATALDIHAALAGLRLKPWGIHRVANAEGGLRPYVLVEFASMKDALACAVRLPECPAQGGREGTSITPQRVHWGFFWCHLALCIGGTAVAPACCKL